MGVTGRFQQHQSLRVGTSSDEGVPMEWNPMKCTERDRGSQVCLWAEAEGPQCPWWQQPHPPPLSGHSTCPSNCLVPCGGQGIVLLLRPHIQDAFLLLRDQSS